MIQRLTLAALLTVFVALLGVVPVQAEPYLAVMTGYKCNVCHVNPTGAGMRNDFGVTYAKVLLPEETVDTVLDSWTGKITDRLRFGGDLRTDWSRDTDPIPQASKLLRSSNFESMQTSPSFRSGWGSMSMSRLRRTARSTKRPMCAMAIPTRASI